MSEDKKPHDQNMLVVYQKIGELDERTRKTDLHLYQFQTEINLKLKDIDHKLDEELAHINSKLDDIIAIKNQGIGSKKTIVVFSSVVIALSSALAWLFDKINFI